MTETGWEVDPPVMSTPPPPSPIHSLCLLIVFGEQENSKHIIFPRLYDQEMNRVVTLQCMWMVLFGQISQNKDFSMQNICVRACVYSMRVYVYSCWSWVASVGLQQDEKDSVLILPGEESRREN